MSRDKETGMEGKAEPMEEAGTGVRAVLGFEQELWRRGEGLASLLHR